MDDVTVARRLVELEAKVAFLFEHLDLDPASASGQPAVEPSPEVIQLARTGRPLDAIRVYQGEAGCSLEEAQAVVERLT